MMFNGVLINKDEKGYSAALKEIEESRLPEGDVKVKIDYSTLNYKDGLAITGKAPVVRSFPMIAGIDFAGTVLESASPKFRPGDAVVLNGWGVGEKHWGGLAQLASVKADWLVPLPDALTQRQAMSIGTAGYTAMLCILMLERHGVTPDKGEIIVTGASGGVGSVATAILSKLGYTVVAVTGRASKPDYLKSLGAAEVLDRSLFTEPGKPLTSERWAGAVDTVGTHVLANICAAMRYRGVVTACGLAGGRDFPSTVAPFILRGVTLVGVDSVMCPHADRLAAWGRLANDLDPEKLDVVTSEIGLSEAIPMAVSLLDGKVRGRIIVDVNR